MDTNIKITQEAYDFIQDRLNDMGRNIESLSDLLNNNTFEFSKEINIVKIKKLTPAAIMPVYQTIGSAGADLTAIGFETIEGTDLGNETQIGTGEALVAKTGLALEIPFGFEGQIRTRSGLAKKEGLIVVNSLGTIDSDYRGEIKILIRSLHQSKLLKVGMKLAQLVIAPIIQAEFIETKTLSNTERQDNGFGSTGV